MEKRTIDEILVELAEAMDISIKNDINIDQKVELKIFTAVRSIEGYTEYLRTTLERDMKRYFSASTDRERDQIKGAFSRTAYLYGKLVKTSEVKETKEFFKGGRKRVNLQK